MRLTKAEREIKKKNDEDTRVAAVNRLKRLFFREKHDLWGYRTGRTTVKLFVIWQGEGEKAEIWDISRSVHFALNLRYNEKTGVVVNAGYDGLKYVADSIAELSDLPIEDASRRVKSRWM